MVQWLKLHVPNAEDLDSILGQGTRLHMMQVEFACVHVLNHSVVSDSLRPRGL